MSRLAWAVILLFVLSQEAGMTGLQHCAQPLVDMEVHKLFAQSVLEP
jgi:hypothetical protein